MAMYEIATLLQPYGNYLLASEMLIPGQGFNYEAIMNITQVRALPQGLDTCDNAYYSRWSPEGSLLFHHGLE